MSKRTDRNLHVVGNQEEQTKRLIEKLLKEIKSEDGQMGELEEHIEKQKKAAMRKKVLITLFIIGIVIVLFLVVYLQTYTSTNVLESYAERGGEEGNYRQFAGGVLKYSRDGITYLNATGEEQWNQPYQIKNPFVEGNEISAAVADKGGNDIYIFQKDGVKGEVHTNLPIEKIAVSEQGIVCAILKNEPTPQIVCYDTVGNILVEHRSSFAGTGYPMDVSISPDGEVMQVLYLCTKEGKVVSKVIYYNFGEAGEEKIDRQVTMKEYEDTVMAEGFFMTQGISVSVGDNVLTIYKGKSVPKEEAVIKIDKEIKSVFHNDNYIGIILKNEGKGGSELRLYNKSGRQVLTKDFTGDYSNAKICGSQIIMYDGKQCSIFLRSGVHRFQGELEHSILEIFPVAGVNKYIVMNADGMEHVRFVK